MTLGRAFIEVHADTRPFARELGPQVRGIVKSVEDSIDTDASKAIGDRVAGSIADGVERNKDDISSSISRSISRSRNKVKIEADVDVDKSAGRFRRAASRLGDILTSSVGKSFNMLGDQAVSATDGVQRLIGGLLNLSSVSLPVAVAIIGIVGALVPLLFSALVVTAAALSNLIGLVPIFVSGLGILLAAIFPIITAFQGFGEALDAVFEKDPEKLAEAMKKLTPAARGVVTELRKAMPFFEQLRKATQQAFFGQLTGTLTKVIAAIRGPLLAGFTEVAKAAGSFLNSILMLATTPGFQEFITTMFAGAAEFFRIMQGPVVTLLGALMNMMVAATPFFLAMTTGLGNFLNRFSNWINESIKDGSFESFLIKAWSTLQDIWALLGAVIELFRTMFGETEAGGRTFLQLVTAAIEDLTKFFKSEDGKKALKAMVDLAIIFGIMLIGAANAAIFLLNQLERVAETMKWILRNLPGIDIGDLPTGGSSKPRGFVGRAFAEGGVVSSPTVAMMGEGYKAEAVIPLTNPRRAQEIADDTGLTNMLSGGGDTFIFYLGEEQVFARMVRVANSVMDNAGRQLTAGTRTA